jgi:hypothetical protein
MQCMYITSLLTLFLAKLASVVNSTLDIYIVVIDTLFIHDSMYAERVNHTEITKTTGATYGAGTA